MTNQAVPSPRLAPDDFRARRNYMPDEAFALVTGTYGPPSDLVPEDEWHSLMALPTDVLLRTSDHHGTQIARLHGLWGTWIRSLPTESSQAPFMFNAGSDASDDFNAAIFEAAHGYYRQGMANLRSALESLTIAARFGVRHDRQGLANWLSGEIDSNFGNARDLLAPVLGVEITEVLKGLNRELSQYIHSRPGATNGALWNGSNGPIWESDSFHKVFCSFRDVMGMAYILLKVGWTSFSIPAGFRPLYDTPGGAWTNVSDEVLNRWLST